MTPQARERVLSRSVLWRRLDLPGHEIGRLARRDQGWELSGTAILCHDRWPCRIEYLVTCNAGWRTETARVRGMVGDRDVDVRVSVDAQQRWYVDGVQCAAVAGCVDIDLGFSPSTNLLPIRRLSLAVGEAREVSAAWLPFPALVFERLSQVYRREGERTYRYESGGGAFTRVLEVDDVGFVTRYPGLWEAECPA